MAKSMIAHNSGAGRCSSLPGIHRPVESFIPMHSFTQRWTGLMMSKSRACPCLQVASSLLGTFIQAMRPYRWHFRHELVPVDKGGGSSWVAVCLGFFLVERSVLSVPRQACLSPMKADWEVCPVSSLLECPNYYGLESFTFPPGH